MSCHDGTAGADGIETCDLRAEQNAVWAYRHGNPDLILCRDTPQAELAKKYHGLFPPSYVELRKQIRVGGLESDLHLLPPMEFHADTSRLVQMLQKGHHGVQLNAEAWDRLITWIDLNAPCHGTWSEFTSIPRNQNERRCELRVLYGGVSRDGEQMLHGDPPFGGDLTPVVPRADSKSAGGIARPESNTIFVGSTSVTKASGREYQTLDLGDGVTLRLVRIPAGQMPDGTPVDRPFWMGTCEVTNRQYAQIDSEHDSRFEHRGSWIFSEEYLGWPLDAPDQPVVRVSWNEAMAFCEQLSERTGRRIRLPSELEWEYACRAGTSTPFWFGEPDADYAPSANLADRSLRKLAADSWGPLPPDLVARDDRFDDGFLVTAAVGSFAPNPFGLYDMHGNVAEWTLGRYEVQDDRRTVRGGSWRGPAGRQHGLRPVGIPALPESIQRRFPHCLRVRQLPDD